jgi:uncharacterized phage protein gp47/JayE
MIRGIIIMVHLGGITVTITIQAITDVNNLDPTTDGYDEETDISLIDRYLIELQKPATSGNVYHYMQWAREVVGVGDTKVIPLWNGANTVKAIIIDDDKISANTELVARAQEYIDPNISGIGSGEAPIGAYCTVVSATSVPINIISTITLETGYIKSEVEEEINKAIKNYLKSIAFKQNFVSYALVSSWLLNVNGVKDWTVFTVNNDIQNVAIADDEIAEFGTVVINV